MIRIRPSCSKADHTGQIAARPGPASSGVWCILEDVVTTDQLHRLIIGEDRRCSDRVCRKICKADDLKLGLCHECWAAYTRIVKSEKTELQERLVRIATTLNDQVSEAPDLMCSVSKILRGPRVFEYGVMAREVHPGAVARVLAFGYDMGRANGDRELVEDVLSIKTSRYYQGMNTAIT